jgi:hypothetical protein
MRQKRLLKGQKKAKALLLGEEEKAHSEEPVYRGQEESTNNLYGVCQWKAT